MAFKLTDTVLSPSSLEKINVKLADSCFHESTINALAYYSSHGYAKFKETAEVLQIIRDWFNTVNVKSAFSGQKYRDNRRLPILGDDDGLTIRYLNEFRNWLENWKSLGKHGLSKPTFAAAIHTLNVIPALTEYLTKEIGLEYVLLGKIQQDFIEGRFGWYRQLCGGNYYNSVPQFLQAEKIIRIRSLVKMDFDMKQIKGIFQVTNEADKNKLSGEVTTLLLSLSDARFNEHLLVESSDQAILYI